VQRRYDECPTERLRNQPGKNIWMMGGGELIASFLDEDAIDEFIVTVVPIFIWGRHSAHRTTASRGAAETAFRETVS
jgi:dihydrofolate reductase